MVDVVKISVEISAEKAVAGAKRVQKATRDMADGLKNVERESKRAGTAVDKTGKAVGANSKTWERAGKSVQEFAAQLAIVQGPLGPIAGRVRTLGAVMGRLPIIATGAALGLTGLAATIRAAVVAGSALEQQMFKMEAVVKATGGTAGITANEMDYFSRELARATLASTESVRNAAIQLATFRSVGGETFKETLRLAQDLSAAGFGSLETSAKSLGRALEDPAVGLSALRRVGVSFSRDQTDVINKLVKTGEIAQAQALILEGVRVQVEGLAEAEAKGLAGAADSLSQSWTELLESFNETFRVAQLAKQGLDLLTAGVNYLRGITQKDISLSVVLSQETGLRDARSQLESLEERRTTLLQIKTDDESKLTVVQEGLASIDRQASAVQGTIDDLTDKLRRSESELAAQIARDEEALAGYKQKVAEAEQSTTFNPLKAYTNMVDVAFYTGQIEQVNKRLQENRRIQTALAKERQGAADVEAAQAAYQISLREQAIAKLVEEEQLAVRRIQNELEVSKQGKISLDVAKKRLQLMQKIDEDDKIRPERKEAVKELVNQLLDEVSTAQSAQRAQEALASARKKAAQEAAREAQRIEKLAENLAKTFDPEYALKIRLEEISEAARQQPGIVTAESGIRERAETAARDRAFQQARSLNQLTAQQQEYLTTLRQQIDLEEQLVRNDYNKRQISIFRSNQMLDEITRKRIASLQRELDMMQQSGAVNTQRANEIAIAMERLRGELGRTAQMFDDIYAGSLGTFFETVIKDTNSVGDAFKQLGTDIFDSINRVVSQDLANSIIGAVGLGDLTSQIFGPNQAGGIMAQQTGGRTPNIVDTGAPYRLPGFSGPGDMRVPGDGCDPCSTFARGGEFATVLTSGAQDIGTQMKDAGSEMNEGMGNIFTNFSASFSNLMTNLFSRNAAGGIGGLGINLGGLFGGTSNASGIAGVTSGSQQDLMLAEQLFGFAKGGSFRVGGSGGIDSQVVTITRPDQDNRISFRATPNERVSVFPLKRFAQGGAILPEQIFGRPSFSGKEPDSLDKVKQDRDRVVVNNTFQINAPNGNVSESTQQQIAGRVMSAISMAQLRTQ